MWREWPCPQRCARGPWGRPAVDAVQAGLPTCSHGPGPAPSLRRPLAAVRACSAVPACCCLPPSPPRPRPLAVRGVGGAAGGAAAHPKRLVLWPPVWHPGGPALRSFHVPAALPALGCARRAPPPRRQQPRLGGQRRRRQRRQAGRRQAGRRPAELAVWRRAAAAAHVRAWHVGQRLGPQRAGELSTGCGPAAWARWVLHGGRLALHVPRRCLPSPPCAGPLDAAPAAVCFMGVYSSGQQQRRQPQQRRRQGACSMHGSRQLQQLRQSAFCCPACLLAWSTRNIRWAGR